MKHPIATVSVGFLLCVLTACQGQPPVEPVSEVPPAPAEEPIVAPVFTSEEGVIEHAGIGIYMQGTHMLQMTGSDRILLLESTADDLDAYMGERVRVTGDVRPTVEQGAYIMDVRAVERLDLPLLEPTEDMSSSSSETAVSSATASSAFSSAAPPPAPVPVPVPAPVPTPVPAPVPPPAVQSSSSHASSVAAAVPTDMDPDLQAQVTAMAKAKVEAATFTQVFCSRHVGFCIPIHKSWYYNSFGATSSSLWHVEVGSKSVDALGQGPLIVNLVSGALDGATPDGSVSARGENMVGYRAWTNNRHFEIIAPQALVHAVQHMTQALSVYQAESQSSQASSN